MASICQWPACLLDSTNVSAFSSVITAFATIALFYVTWVLAKETKVLSRASSQAHVTATIEPNAWGVTYVDLLVSNSGNAVAYDIFIEFDPPLPHATGHRRDLSLPLQKISILRPGQILQSNLAAFSEVSKKEYSVKISWKEDPRSAKRESLSYQLSMLDYEGVSYLGARSPTVMIAEQIKKIRDDWKGITSGAGKLKIDTFSHQDRTNEAREREEWIKQIKRDVTDNDRPNESEQSTQQTPADEPSDNVRE